MLKYILVLATIMVPLLASQPESSTPSVSTNVFSQSLSEAIALIIKDLEQGIEQLDSPNATVIKEHLYTIDTIAKTTLIKVIALIKIGKHEPLEPLLIKKLASTYRTFHEKLLNVLPKEKKLPDTTPLDTKEKTTVDSMGISAA